MERDGEMDEDPLNERLLVCVQNRIGTINNTHAHSYTVSEFLNLRTGPVLFWPTRTGKSAWGTLTELPEAFTARGRT